METYVRDELKPKRQDSIRGILIDIKLYLKTLDETVARDLTMNYSLSEMITRVLPNSGLFVPSTMTSFSAVEKSGTNYSGSATKQQWCIFHWYTLKHNCRVIVFLENVSPLKNMSNAKVSSIDCCTILWRVILQSIFLTALCDFSFSKKLTLYVQWKFFKCHFLQLRASNLVSLQTEVNRKWPSFAVNFTEGEETCVIYHSTVQYCGP